MTQYMSVTVTPAANSWSKPRKETKIDIERFGRDLAQALNGRLVLEDSEWKGTPRYASIVLDGDRTLTLYADEYKQRISIGIKVTSMGHGEWSSYHDEQKTTDATVNPDARPIALIAKDISKRVIQASEPALEARRAYKRAQDAAKSGVLATAAALRAACPTLTVRVNDDSSGGTFYSSEPYLSGRINYGGSLTVERLDSLTVAKVADLFKVLKGGAA